MEKLCFNVRIYALITNNNDELLLADEYHHNRKMIKLPGGGLEFGESHAECLQREAAEEMHGQEIQVGEHFYTTDYFQPALFHTNVQVMSIYYWAKIKGEPKFDESKIPFEKTPLKNGSFSFRWQKIDGLNPADFIFPTDQLVIKKVKKWFNEKKTS